MKRAALVIGLLCQAALAQMTDERLGQVKRIYVEPLQGAEAAAQIRDMLINSLQATRMFVVTENPDRADATLRGSAEDLVFTDTFQSQDGITARASTNSRSSSSGSIPGASVSIGENQSTRIAERKHEAMAAVRLVDNNGDVLWSTTKESLGAKFRGASADVADKVTRQLVADVERARRSTRTGAPSPGCLQGTANQAVCPDGTSVEGSLLKSEGPGK